MASGPPPLGLQSQCEEAELNLSLSTPPDGPPRCGSPPRIGPAGRTSHCPRSGLISAYLGPHSDPTWVSLLCLRPESPPIPVLKAMDHVKAHLSIPVCSKPSKAFPFIQGACLAPGTSQAPSVSPGSTQSSSLCHRRRLPQPGGHTPAQPSPSTVRLPFHPVTPHLSRPPAAPISRLPVPASSQSLSI